MFEGFERRTIGVGEAEITLRLRGRGPAVVLLHGYPQTHVCWHRVAPSLAERFTVIVPDLRGYGDSRGPAPDPENLTHSKRAMAGDLAGVLDALDIGSAAVAGHDRGGRVAYRFALDHPDRITGLAVLDMIPTIEMWERMDADGFIAGYHWQFLAQPGGLPERMIAHDPDDYLEHTLRSWTVVDDCFSGEAMAEYRRCFRTPSVIAACCADYRAGATVDRELDRADRAAGRRIRHARRVAGMVRAAGLGWTHRVRALPAGGSAETDPCKPVPVSGGPPPDGGVTLPSGPSSG